MKDESKLRDEAIQIAEIRDKYNPRRRKYNQDDEDKFDEMIKEQMLRELEQQERSGMMAGETGGYSDIDLKFERKQQSSVSNGKSDPVNQEQVLN